MVKVYSKHNCVQCKMTTRWLDKNNVPHEVIKVDEDETAFAYVESLGYKQVPVVEYAGSRWSGFQPDRLRDLVS